jgi:hypothetical protein
VLCFFFLKKNILILNVAELEKYSDLGDKELSLAFTFVSWFTGARRMTNQD